VTESSSPGGISEIARVYRASRKDRDIFWNVYVARPVAAVVVVLLRPTPLTPNQVTFLGLLVFLGAAAVLALWQGWTGLLVAAGVLEASYLLDCADGQLARLKGMTSKVGAYLDFLIDEIKALLLVAACSLRLWLRDDDVRWLLAGLGGLVLVASATALTTFVRRPEYAGEEQAPGVQRVAPRPKGLFRLALWLVERLAKWIVHYPSWFVYVALADGLPGVDGAAVFLCAYLTVYLLYLGRTSLGIFVRLAHPRFYESAS